MCDNLVTFDVRVRSFCFLFCSSSKMIFQFAPKKKKEQHTQNEKGEPEPQTPTFVLMSSIIKQLKNKNKTRRKRHTKHLFKTTRTKDVHARGIIFHRRRGRTHLVLLFHLFFLEDEYIHSFFGWWFNRQELKNE